jgi:hypothetical protein
MNFDLKSAREFLDNKAHDRPGSTIGLLGDACDRVAELETDKLKGLDMIRDRLDADPTTVAAAFEGLIGLYKIEFDGRFSAEGRIAELEAQTRACPCCNPIPTSEADEAVVDAMVRRAEDSRTAAGKIHTDGTPSPSLMAAARRAVASQEALGPGAVDGWAEDLADAIVQSCSSEALPPDYATARDMAENDEAHDGHAPSFYTDGDEGT